MTEKELLEKEGLRMDEGQIQHTCVHWWRWYIGNLEKDEEWKRMMIHALYAIPNGGNRTAREGMKMKRDGALKGVPDLHLAFPKGKYHGLFVEMKRPAYKSEKDWFGHSERRSAGVPSKEQKEYAKWFKELGYYHSYCYGLMQFIDIIAEYFGVGDEEKAQWKKDALRVHWRLCEDFSE